MKKYLLFFALPCIFILPMVFYQTSLFRNGTNEENEYSSVVAMKRSIEPISCESMLAHLNTTIPLLLVDPDVLRKIINQDCSLISGRPVKVAVNVMFLSEKSVLEDSRFEVMYFSNDSKKDYLDFRTEPRRIVPRMFATHRVANVEVPSDIPMFLEFWKRSKFIECMNLFIPRPGAKIRLQAAPATAALARLRNELISHGMFPFLNGGTLLGWYRECSVIPHTSDMDVAIFSENYQPGFLESMQKSESAFRVSRKFGMINDSFELTVAPREGYSVFIDVFVMYKAEAENGTEAHHWVGGVSPDGTKFKYSYPLYDPYCAADLHGHLFWVTCTPNEKLVKEYGQLWYRDHHTSKYSWSSSGKNVQKNGKWTKEQMKTVYNIYGTCLGDKTKNSTPERWPRPRSINSTSQHLDRYLTETDNTFFIASHADQQVTSPLPRARMKKYPLFFALPCIFILPMVFYQTSLFRNGTNDENEYSSVVAVKRSIEPISCELMLAHLKSPIPLLLVDPEILGRIANQNCSLISGRPVKVAVNVRFRSEKGALEKSRFDVMFFSNSSTKDYLNFRKKPRRIIPKMFATHRVGNLEVPSDIPMFLEFWKRSKFIKCMNLYVPRPKEEAHLQAAPATAALARLRNELISHGMFPFLNGGTLLGWYRECSVIPHTSDMDVAVFSENYQPGFLEGVLKNESAFRVSRKFGMINDSFEFTVEPKEGYWVPIDVFVMYKAEAENGTEAHHWVGGVSPDGTKYKYSYPLYDPYCAADLHGHLFWVTCTPNEKLVKEYGQRWYRDHHTNEYSWYSSGENVQENGKWTEEQMKTVYNMYE